MKIKKLLTVFVGVALTLSLTGCGFSIGTSGESGDYSDVFTDPITSGKIHTMKSYQFTVGDYGSTTVLIGSSGVKVTATFWSAELLNNYGYTGQGSVLSLPIFT